MLIRPRSVVRVVAMLLLAIAPLVIVAPANGQGTSGLLPDPISSRELSGYADRLGLSDQQRLAIETFHEQYRMSFHDLRESEIEDFLAESSGLGMGMGGNPQAIDRVIKDFERIMTRITALDDRLFNQVLGVLTEEQAMRMPRARQARQRARYGTGLSRMVGFLNPAARVDLSKTVASIDLPAAELEQIDPLLANYETSLTTRMRDLHQESLDMAREATKAMSSFELDEQAMADPDRRRELLEAMRNMWTELTRTLTEQSMEVSELGRKTIPRLRPLMGAEAAFDLHERYYGEGYREFTAGRDAAVTQFDKALRLDGLSDEQRQSIVDLRDAFHRDVYRITGDAADLIDTQRQKRQMFRFGAQDDEQRQHEEKLADLREQRAKSNERAIASLQAVLGAEMAETLPDVIAGVESTDEASAVGPVLVAPDGSAVQVDVTAIDPAGTPPAGTDPFLPGPISPRDVERYANLLQLDETNRTVLIALHQDYEELFRELAGEATGRVVRAQQSLWRLGDDGVMVPPAEADVGKVFDLRRRALQTIMQVDETFFENLQALASDERSVAMERIRLSRQRDVYNRARGPESLGGSGRAIRFAAWQMDGSRETSLDVVRLVESLEPEPEDLQSIDTPMLEYERAATAAFKSFYEMDMRYQEALEGFNARAAQQREGRQDQFRWGGEYRQLMEREGLEIRNARESLIKLNRGSIDRVSAALPEDVGAELRRLYERRAFPGEFDDANSAAKRLTAALELADLTIDQRSAVAEMSAEFHADHETLSRRMVAVRMRSGDLSDRQDWQRRLEAQREIEKLRSQRNDLSEKAAVRLRALLNEEQIGKLGL